MRFWSKIGMLALMMGLTAGGLVQADRTRGQALVYDGEFASGAHDFEKMLVDAGYEVHYFTDVNTLNTKLAAAQLVLFPGTNDKAGSLDTFVHQFQRTTIEALKAWVKQGGAYIGVCGGAYIMATTYTTAFDSGPGLGLVPLATEGYLTNDAATILDIEWKNSPRSIYYQLGPRFLTSASATTEVTATYGDGSVAACLIRQGSGRVYLIGPHPEVLAANLEPGDVPDGSLGRLTDTSDLLTDLMADSTVDFDTK